MVEQLLARLECAARRERAAHLGAGPIGREHDVGLEPLPGSIARLDQWSTVGLDADTLLAEPVFDAVTLRGQLVKQGVQRRARD